MFTGGGGGYEIAPEGGSLMVPLTITSDLELFCTVFVQASLQLSLYFSIIFYFVYFKQLEALSRKLSSMSTY